MYGYGNSMFLATHGILARTASGGGVDPDAQAFITAASITNPTQQAAINQLVLDLKGYSIWTKFKAIYPIVGGSASSHAVNLKTPGTYNMTFATGWTHSSTGMTPNGATYADTSLNINTVMSLNSMAFGVYSRTNTAAGNKAHGAETPYTEILERNASNVAYASINDNGFTGVTVASSDSRGFFQASRTASNALRIVRNTTHATSTAVTSSKPNLNFYFGASAVSLTGAFVRANDRQIAFGYIADGFTQTECDNLYTAVQAFQTTLGRSIGTQTVSDADAQAFVNAANITDQVEANAINNLVIGMKADGLWTKMKAIYPIVGGVASSHAVNLKTPGTYNLTFASGMTHSSTGMISNGSSGYADTNFIPNSNLNIDSTHISFYSRTSQINSFTCEMGCSDNANELPTLSMYIKYNNGNYLGFSPDYNVTGIAVANSDSKGFYIDSRTANNSHKAYKNNTTFGTNTATRVQTLLPQRSMYLLAYNYFVGTPAGYSGKECAFASVGDGLTDIDATNLYNRVNTFQTTLNRNV